MTVPIPSVIELTQRLIQRPSVSPDDAGCTKEISELLAAAAFKFTDYSRNQTTNLWAQHGQNAPLFVWAAHTDVVPPGPLDQWEFPPFAAEIQQNRIYGRGAVDMKSSLAAMTTATLKFIQDYPQYSGSIAFLITSDEESSAVDGTTYVVEQLRTKNLIPNWCIVGEPSSTEKFGDTIKIGRRGTLNAELRIHGKQGHIAYPHLADNPIHRSLEVLTTLTTKQWDQGNKDFPATALQISNIHAGTGASNVIPAYIDIQFNFRYSPEVTAEQLQQEVDKILRQHHLNFNITWQHSGKPFYTPAGQLVKGLQEVISQQTSQTPQLSTEGGTSDGRFIATLGCEVVEFGPSNKTIHQINEFIEIEELLKLEAVYYQILHKLFIHREQN
jgi:succinyl-diaminopimelate desuccinylase